jgi:predicted phosphodiesterase
VHGNVDAVALVTRLPARRIVQADSVQLGLVHDAGPAKGRLERLRAAFPGCAAVVFGHSHIPLHEQAPDGFQIFNPGSPTDRRRQPRHTMGEARVERGRVAFRLVDLGP